MEREQNLEGGSLLRKRQNTKENGSTDQSKTKHIKIFRQIMQPKNTKTNLRPNRAVSTVIVNWAHRRCSTLAI